MLKTFLLLITAAGAMFGLSAVIKRHRSEKRAASLRDSVRTWEEEGGNITPSRHTVGAQAPASQIST